MMNRSRRGATLIELLVVVAMIGVLGGVVAAALPAPQYSSSVTLAQDVAVARSEALRRGERVDVHRGPSGGRWLVIAQPDGRVAVDSGGVRWSLLSGGSDAP